MNRSNAWPLLIVAAACVTSLTILAIAPVSDDSKPQPVIDGLHRPHRYKLDNNDVFEFRDSNGRQCVLVQSFHDSVSLDCYVPDSGVE